jgi:threonine/homoserine/homoserine lactone efflux protein
MPLDPNLLLAFLLACVVLIVTPGPDMAFVLGQTLGGGRRRGWAATAGIYTGVLGHVALAVLGVSALLTTAPGLFRAIQLAGAAYLLWLGFGAVRAALRPGPAGAAAQPVPPRAALRQGIITNLLNPKVGLFFLAFLPQFVDPGRAPAWLQMLLLGVMLPLLALPFYALLIAAASRIARGLGAAQRWLDGASGTIFLLLGLRLLLGGR